MRAAIALRLPLLVLSAVVLLSLPVRSAQAADKATCTQYTREAVAKAQGVRALACRTDADGPRWTSDHAPHMRWCRASAEDVVAKETARRRTEFKSCQACRAYANIATSAAADNIKLRCGLDGSRWSEKSDAHFQWCMALRENADPAASEAAGASVPSNLEQAINQETGVRVRAIARCKAQQPGGRNVRRSN